MPTINVDLGVEGSLRFIDLVRGFTNKRIVENPANLPTHVEATWKYLFPTRPDATGRVQP